jgi:hypothetical protein
MVDPKDYGKVPVALMPADFIDKKIVEPTLACATAEMPPGARLGGHFDASATINGVVCSFRTGIDLSSNDAPYLVPEEASAVRVFFDFALELSIDTTNVGLEHSVALLIVNKLGSQLTLTLDGGACYHGNTVCFPSYRTWNDQHSRHEFSGPDYVVPAGDAKEKTVGIGLFGTKWTNGFYGCAAGLQATTDDPNVPSPIWIAIQSAYGRVDHRYNSIAVTDDLAHYSNLNDFYSKECDSKRSAFMTCTLDKGQGKKFDENYKITAAIAGLDPCSAASHGDYDKRQYGHTQQAIVVFDTNEQIPS